VHVGPGSDRRSVRDSFSEAVLAAANASSFPARRPSRFGNGSTMTVAEFEGDYRIAQSGGTLDRDRTIRVIRNARTVLASAAGMRTTSASA
jgi:hypothetical protein